MKTIIEPEDYEGTLRRWRGGVAKVWLYHVSLRRLALRIQAPAEMGVLYILGSGCEHIHGPFVWDNANISMTNAPATETGVNVWRVSDLGAGFELRCSSAALAHGPANEVDQSFDNFFGDSPEAASLHARQVDQPWNPAVQVVPISARDFADWTPSRKLITHDHSRRFGAITFAEGQEAFAIAWPSELVDPTVATGTEGETWVGVDQRVACVTHDGRIVVSLGLASSIVLVRCFERITVVLTETEAIVFNRGFSISTIGGLPDIPADVIEEGGHLVVMLLSGERKALLQAITRASV